MRKSSLCFGLLLHGLGGAQDDVAQDGELRPEGDERHHDLELHRLTGLLLGGDRRFEGGARLHLGNLRIENGETAAAETEHRIEFGELRDARLQLFGRHAEVGGDGGNLVGVGRQELVQRRIEQPHGDGQPGHDLEQLLEIGALHRQDLGERGAAPGGVFGEDHLAHGEDALGVEEHVLGAAQADALGAELARLTCIARGVGVGAHAQPALGVGPAHERGEGAGQLRLAHLGAADDHLPGAAVDGDDVALVQRRASRPACVPALASMRSAPAPDTHGPAHATRHDRGVAGGAAARREDADGGVHAVDVLGARLGAHEDDLAAARALGLGVVGGEDDLARGRAGRSGQAGGQHVLLRVGIERRVQQLIERRRRRRASPPPAW